VIDELNLKSMKIKIDFKEIPQEILDIAKKFQENKKELYLVGGCVRDMLMGIQPKDWDLTTNAKPKEIQKICSHTFYENDFGTVGVVLDKNNQKIEQIKEKLEKNNVSQETKDLLEKELVIRETLKNIEITPFRTESGYSDNRHPDKIEFSDKIEDDLSRRDFTINAIAYNPLTGELIDLFDGLKDLKEKKIRTVLNPNDRFQEDGLRIMRAVRFSAQLGFEIEENSLKSIKKNKELLKNISKERIQIEFNKIIMSERPEYGLNVTHETGILEYFLPELEENIGVIQGGAHVYDVYNHILKALQSAADKKYPLYLRLAALFHDIGKGRTAEWSDKKQGNTFFAHEYVGAKMTEKILKRLKYSNEIVSRVTNLVRNHMFFADPDKITLSAVRRVIRKVGGEKEVWDLIKLRIADRLGMGRPKERTYRLRMYEAMIEEALRSPISVKDLKINGDQLISEFHMKPGRKIGQILHALMGITLETPENNNYEFLAKKVEEYLKLPDEELEKLAKVGRETMEIKENQEIKKIHRKHKVK